MLADAERETLASLTLNPDQPDARNLLGVIYAEQGSPLRASLEWRDLVRDEPDYQPARANLELLGGATTAANGVTAAYLPRAAAVHAIMDEQ
jgi:lipoprotein NlpI